MGYLRAEDILPAELIGRIQQYADGVTLYISPAGGRPPALGHGQRRQTGAAPA